MTTTGRSFGLICDQTTTVAYRKLYQSGLFPGTPGTGRAYGTVAALLLRCTLPTGRLTVANQSYSGKALQIILRVPSAIDVVIDQIDLVASSGPYILDILRRVSGATVFCLGPDSEIGVRMLSTSYGLLVAGESINAYGWAIEESEF